MAAWKSSRLVCRATGPCNHKKKEKERNYLAEVLYSKIIDFLLHLHPRQGKKEAVRVKQNHLVKSFAEL